LAAGLMKKLLTRYRIEARDVSHIIATGQGRRSVDIADLARTGITTFARGAHFIDEDVDIVADVGGHGIRVMRMGEMGVISDFRTNDKCSTGTGCFMDTMATALEVSIEDVGERSLHSKLAEHVNASCTVFAESEVVSLIAKGKVTEDILAGLHQMVSRKIVSLINSTQSKGKVLICGGVALNIGVVKEIEGSINREMVVPDLPHMVGALGAALSSPTRKRKAVVSDTSVEDTKMEKRTLLDRLLRWK
ncbi:MAG: acyl-CoA dehydratase activase, partial [Candidatus Thermoplasmatota archaeon]|nr:acyl-CoA dehydratase activase [Candidatus Thermoplasmatota archaeon]